MIVSVDPPHKILLWIKSWRLGVVRRLHRDILLVLLIGIIDIYICVKKVVLLWVGFDMDLELFPQFLVPDLFTLC